jgi:hypothetical protein
VWGHSVRVGGKVDSKLAEGAKVGDNVGGTGDTALKSGVGDGVGAEGAEHSVQQEQLISSQSTLRISIIAMLQTSNGTCPLRLLSCSVRVESEDSRPSSLGTVPESSLFFSDMTVRLAMSAYSAGIVPLRRFASKPRIPKVGRRPERMRQFLRYDLQFKISCCSYLSLRGVQVRTATFHRFDFDRAQEHLKMVKQIH